MAGNVRSSENVGATGCMAVRVSAAR